MISYGLDFYFKREMARAGRITIRGREFPKMQLMTVEELLEGKRFDTPPVLGRQQKAQQQLVYLTPTQGENRGGRYMGSDSSNSGSDSRSDYDSGSVFKTGI